MAEDEDRSNEVEPLDEVEPPPDGEPVPEPAATGTRRVTGRTVRIGLFVLGLLGVLSTILGGLTAANPDEGVCASARAELEDANGDDGQDGDIDLDDDAIDDLSCEEAIAQAEQLEDVDLPSEGTYRTSGTLGLAVGLVQLVGAFWTLRTMQKRARMVALVGTGLGIIILGTLLFPIGIIAFGYVVYAILFSADARAVFGDPGGPRLFRPRTAPPDA
jgi:hypothetical protein